MGSCPSRRIDDAAGTLTIIWEPVYSEVPIVPVVPVETKKVELCSTFQKRPRCIAVVPIAYVDMETRLNIPASLAIPLLFHILKESAGLMYKLFLC